MDIIQSWLVSVSRYHYNVYEQRILLTVIDGCQEYFRKKYLKALTQVRPEEVRHDKMLSIRIASVLKDDDTHYSRVKDAVRALQSKRIEVFNKDTQVWESCPLILLVRHRQRSGELQVTVPALFLRAIYDLRMGWSSYDLEQALTLPTAYAMRMYAIVAHQSRPLEMRIDTLKSMFAVTDKYTQTRDFLKRVIDPCIEALSSARLPSFKYERLFAGRRVVAIRIYRIEPERVIANTSNPHGKTLRDMLGDEVSELLIHRVGFTYKELGAHSALLRKLIALPNYIDIVRGVVHRWYKYGKDKGYIIAAFKSECR